MNDFITYVENVCGKLSPQQQQLLIANTTVKQFRRQEVVHDEHSANDILYYVASGLLKKCYHIKSREYIIDFHDQKSMIMNYQLDREDIMSNCSIVAVENATVISLDYAGLEAFTRENHTFERYLRHYHEDSIMKTMSWNRKILGYTAEELYLYFMSEKKDISQRISIGELASYLGIAQATLSRIRSGLAKKEK